MGNKFNNLCNTKRKKIVAVCICIVIFFLAMGLTFYPVIASRYSERHQSEIHTSYQEQLQEIDKTLVTETKARAVKYNSLLIPWNSSESEELDAFSSEGISRALESYKEQLDIIGNGIMGYVEIPKINVVLPIYHGTAESTLELGIGHLVGSSLPIGGENSHSVLTGHSGMASQKMFSDLPNLQIGDVFYLSVLDENLAYQIDQIVTVLPHDTTYLQIEENKDYCTLITCTPFGVNTHRLLVRGSRIPYVEEEKVDSQDTFVQESNNSTWEDNYKLGLVWGISLTLFAIISAIFINYVRKRLKTRNKTEDESGR